MPLTTNPNDRLSALATRGYPTALLATAMLMLSSCTHLTPCPFHDQLADQAAVTTPSVEGILASERHTVMRSGEGEPKQIALVSGAVRHRPLYFEDNVETDGSDDGQFAWTGEDYRNIVVEPVWFLLNLVTAPVDMVIDPPWSVMVSDGEPGCRKLWVYHDSARWACKCPHSSPEVNVEAHD